MHFRPLEKVFAEKVFKIMVDYWAEKGYNSVITAKVIVLITKAD